MCLLLPAPHDLDIEIPCMSIVLVRIYNEGVVSVVELDNYKDHGLISVCNTHCGQAERNDIPVSPFNVEVMPRMVGLIHLFHRGLAIMREVT